jgi:NAD(P)-dependent dehydrogenase (short-subunit alcohol dehydrogenase family)
MSDAMRLFGLKAVVTDAASGIGEAITRTFVKQGAEVLAIDAVSSGIDTHYRKVSGVTGVELDMTAEDASPQFENAVKSNFGSIDIVVANFDWHGDAPIRDVDTTLTAELANRMCSRIAAIADSSLPLLQKSPAGRIIAIGCLRSVFAIDGESAYRASEKALHELMGRQAARCAELGVTANVIQPGAVMTPASRRVFSARRDLRDHCIRISASKRLAEPVDIAKVVLFLATDDSVFVSGSVIRADGGIART